VAAVVTACLGWANARLAAETIPTTNSGSQAESKPAGTTPEEADAIALFNRHDFDGALKRLKEAAKKNPDSPPAQVLMARLCAQAGLAAGMRNSLEQATVEAPTDPEAYLEMGDILLRDGWVSAAELLYRKGGSLLWKFDKSAKRKEALMARTYSGLSLVAEARRDWAGSQKQLEAWLKYDPKSAVAMQRMARCLFQEKNPAAALDRLKAAAKADSKLLTPEAVLAELYEQAGDRENARKWFFAALKAAPNDLATHVAVSHWALDRGEFDLAKTQADAAAKIDPESLDAMMLNGLVAMFQRDFPTAEHYFQEAHIHWPHSFAASNDLALALVEQPDEAKKRQALDFARNNVEQAKNTEAAATYGWVLYKLGRIDEAERFLQIAGSRGQVSPDTAYYIARVAVERGREAQAKQVLEDALKSPARFYTRSEAQSLLERLKK
jgi:tetratricopeptide (TPR) repeat protein